MITKRKQKEQKDKKQRFLACTPEFWVALMPVQPCLNCSVKQNKTRRKKRNRRRRKRRVIGGAVVTSEERRCEVTGANMAAVDVVVNMFVRLWRFPGIRPNFPWMFLVISFLGSIIKELELVPQTYFSSSRNVFNV